MQNGARDGRSGRTPVGNAVRPETDSAPTVVSLRGVGKRFTIRKDNSLKERIVTLGRAGRRHSEDFWALQDITFDITAGSTIGLIGPNGSGKSTLLKLIGGILDPTTGSVDRRGRLAALIELGAGMHPDLTGRENVFLNAAVLGIPKEVVEERFDSILLFSGIGEFIDTQVKFYSSGMYVRLAFAVAINTDPDVLLVDEVLAVGDEQFQKKCMDKIREFQEQGRTIILVSHSLGQVQDLCDTAVVLHEGRVKFRGPARQAVQNFREILEGRRIAEAAASDPEADPTQGHVSDVYLGVVDGDISRPVPEGSTIDLQMKVSYSERLEEWHCGFFIENALGNLVYGSDTQRLDAPLPPLDGPTVVAFRIPDVRFGSGPYFVHAFLADGRGEHLAIARDAARFLMEDDERSVGSHRMVTSVLLVQSVDERASA
jgi:ABC-2 type transport system ATP-binding protein